MRSDDMTKCSLISTHHQMTNARAGLGHHYEGDPLFDGLALGRRRDTVSGRRIQPTSQYLKAAVRLLGRALRLFGH